MSHELTETDSMMSVRQKPWHGLGAVLDDYPKSIDDALVKSGLDWDVIQRPVKVSLPVEGSKTKNQLHTLDERWQDGHPGYFVNVRTDIMAPLGIVTGRYTPVQNREAFSFLASLFGSELHFETAGSLMGGRRVWVLMKLPDNVEVAGDEIGPYSFIQNSHDGKSSVVTALTPVRIVCNNTLTAALSQAKGVNANRTYTIRHLGDMESKLAEAQEVMQVTIDYYENFKLVGDKLGRMKVSDRKATNILERLLPVTPDMGDRAARNREETREVVRAIFKGNGPGGDTTGNAPGTYWTLYNAATEYADWCREERKEGGRFQRSLDDPDGFKAKAWNLVLSGAGF